MADAARAPAPGRRARSVATARVVVGVLVLGTLASSYAVQRAAGRTEVVDFLGYFTNLTSLVAALLLALTGARALRGRQEAAWSALARGVLTACLLVVAVVYHLAVHGDGGTGAPWVSAVLHGGLPAVALLDWVLVADRPALPWRRLWLVLPYPLLWLVVVLVRGATDGWVPYGFLLPEHGAGSLVLHVVGLLAVLLAAGALVWGASRVALGPGDRRAAPASA